MLARMMSGAGSGVQLELAGRHQFDCYYKSYLDQIKEIHQRQQQHQQQVVGSSFRNEMNVGQELQGRPTRRRRHLIIEHSQAPDTSSGKSPARAERPASEQPINLSGPTEAVGPASPAHTASNTPLLGNSSSAPSCDPSQAAALHQGALALTHAHNRHQQQNQNQFERLHNLSAVASALSWSTGGQQADQQQFMAAHHQHQLMLAAATAAAAMASQHQQQHQQRRRRPKHHHLTPASNRYSRQQTCTTTTTTPAQLQNLEPPPEQPRPAPSSGGSGGSAGSGGRRRRGSRKCRKVYGMAQRQLWCTQCKWKKACSRFCCGPSIASIGDHLKLLAGLN